MQKKKKTKKKSFKNAQKHQTTTEKWYNNTFFVLLMLITVFPIGLYLVLTNKRLKEELWPTVKVIIIGGVIIIAYVLINNEWEKPVLEVKPEVTYSIDDKFGTDTLITDYVTKVEDNETDLTIEDVNIVKYDNLDFNQVGTQTITFMVKDDAQNVTTKEAKLIITK